MWLRQRVRRWMEARLPRQDTQALTQRIKHKPMNSFVGFFVLGQAVCNYGCGAVGRTSPQNSLKNAVFECAGLDCFKLSRPQQPFFGQRQIGWCAA